MSRAHKDRAPELASHLSPPERVVIRRVQLHQMVAVIDLHGHSFPLHVRWMNPMTPYADSVAAALAIRSDDTTKRSCTGRHARPHKRGVSDAVLRIGSTQLLGGGVTSGAGGVGGVG